MFFKFFIKKYQNLLDNYYIIVYNKGTVKQNGGNKIVMENHEINLSAHGYERLIERTRCKRHEVIEHLINVWEKGKTVNSYDKKSSIVKYLTNVCKNGGDDRSIRVKGNTLYIFNKAGTAFITCYDIPQKVVQDKRNKNGKVHFIH